MVGLTLRVGRYGKMADMNALTALTKSAIVQKAIALAVEAKKALDRARDDDPTVKPIRGFLVWKSYWRGKDPFDDIRCADCKHVPADGLLLATTSKVRVCASCHATRRAAGAA